MLAKVLLCDQNKLRQKRLHEQLERLAGGSYEIFAAKKEPSELEFDLILCPEKEASFCQKLSPEARILIWERDFPQTLQVSSVHKKIEENLQVWKKQQNYLAEGKKASLSLIFCFDNQIKDKWLPRFLEALLNQGLYLLYLPIMPLYRVPSLEEKIEGKKLTDLLISLDQEKTDQEVNLGHYLFMHSKGYMTFRLSQAADDLISCPPYLLRRLLLFIRQYLEEKTEPALALIDCEQLGIDTTTRLIQICDIFYADAVFKDDGGGKAARRELAKMLAALPSSVEFRLLNEVRT